MRARIVKIAPAALLLTGFVLFLVFPSFTSSVPHFCLIEGVSGYRCAGCGMSAALIYVSQAEWRAAFNANPAVFGLLFLVCAELVQAVSSRMSWLHRLSGWLLTLSLFGTLLWRAGEALRQ